LISHGWLTPAHGCYMHFCLYLFVLRPVNDDSNDESRLNKKIGNMVKMLFYKNCERCRGILYVTNVNRGQLLRKRVDCGNSLNESIANMVRDID
jgi:hypothetical protein